VLIATAYGCAEEQDHSFWAICADTPPSDCYFGNTDFANYIWYQGRTARELAEDRGLTACFEYVNGYSDTNPYPDCCPDGEAPPP
jgi:hypothetical protein